MQFRLIVNSFSTIFLPNIKIKADIDG